MIAQNSAAYEPPAAKQKVPPAIHTEAEPFEIGRVTLLESPFKQAQEQSAAFLLHLNPDRLLSWFRKEAGLESKAEPYEGWERMGIAGHSLGHYLSGLAQMYQATGNEEFKRRADYIVRELAACQKANGDGYVAAIPNGREVFDKVRRGEIDSKGFDLNGCWVPWYTLHKQFAGLRDAYLLCDNRQALEVMAGLGDWSIEVTKNLDDALFQKMLNCEHGGMNESLADLYALTGEEKYRMLARKFHHRVVLDPLSRREDNLAGLHSNTQVPKLVGAARIYELTGDPAYRSMTDFYWQTMTDNHSYAPGGNSEGEYLSTPGKLNDRLSPHTMETCNTHNMLRLTKLLFCRETRAEYADYYERALYNHILASQNPTDGMVTYFVPLQTGSHKPFSNPPDTHFTCCVGTGMENHARYGESIYFHKDDTLWINLFIPSELNWSEKGLRIRQESPYPHGERIQFTVASDNKEKGVRAVLKIRRPFWAKQDVTVKVNGETVRVLAPPSGYIILDREWRDGDRIEYVLPLSLRLEPMPDNPRRVAIFHGPILLCGDLGPIDSKPVEPVLLTDWRPVEAWLKPVEGQPSTFKTDGVCKPDDLILKPFYAAYDYRYIVYWDLFTEAEWETRQAAIRAEQERLKALEARTVDHIRVGEMQPERDHHFQGEKTNVGDHQGRKWRDAWGGGWFSFEMKATDEPVELLATYWGGDERGRTFDILVDGEKIAMQTLEKEKPGEFFEVAYPIPSKLMEGKDRFTVRFQAHPDKRAGGLFGLRLLRREEK